MEQALYGQSISKWIEVLSKFQKDCHFYVSGVYVSGVWVSGKHKTLRHKTQVVEHRLKSEQN